MHIHCAYKGNLCLVKCSVVHCSLLGSTNHKFPVCVQHGMFKGSTSTAQEVFKLVKAPFIAQAVISTGGGGEEEDLHSPLITGAQKVGAISMHGKIERAHIQQNIYSSHGKPRN